MTPSERERRIEGGMKAWLPLGSSLLDRMVVAAILDAADEAVPVVPATWIGLLEHLDAMYPADVFTGESGDVGARLVVLARKLAEVEAAARDFSAALRAIRKRLEEAGHGEPDPSTEWYMADVVLRAHPSFSGEEGTD